MAQTDKHTCDGNWNVVGSGIGMVTAQHPDCRWGIGALEPQNTADGHKLDLDIDKPFDSGADNVWIIGPAGAEVTVTF